MEDGGEVFSVVASSHTSAFSNHDTSCCICISVIQTLYKDKQRTSACNAPVVETWSIGFSLHHLCMVVVSVSDPFPKGELGMSGTVAYTAVCSPWNFCMKHASDCLNGVTVSMW